MPARRTSNRMKVLNGTDRPDRMRDEPDLPEPDDFDPPSWLFGTDAVDFWDQLIEILKPARVLTADNLTALGHLANLHGRCVRLWRAGESPTAAELTQLRLYLTEFGLTPASRSKAGPVGESENSNEFAKLERTG